MIENERCKKGHNLLEWGKKWLSCIQLCLFITLWICEIFLIGLVDSFVLYSFWNYIRMQNCLNKSILEWNQWKYLKNCNTHFMIVIYYINKLDKRRVSRYRWCQVATLSQSMLYSKIKLLINNFCIPDWHKETHHCSGALWGNIKLCLWSRVESNVPEWEVVIFLHLDTTAPETGTF